MFAADGTRLGFIQSDELRTPVGWSEIPADLKNATVAIEDQRFYKNDGVDLTGIFRAAIKDIAHGAALQGGSTITMQLCATSTSAATSARSGRRSSRRSSRSTTTKRHSKHSILTSYLNSVPYGTVGGQTAIGVQAAARIFFDKPASQLNLEQSALLAGLPQAPSQYNPLPESRGRQANGATRCSRRWPNCTTSARAQAAAAEAAPLEVAPRPLLLRSARRTSSSNTCASSCRPLRREDRRTGRAEGLHDDRPEHAATRAQSDRRSAQRARRPGLGDRHARTRTTATSRRWPSPRATSSRSTTSPPTATASRARRSRRSTSPTRSRAASTRTAPTTSPTRCEPGWLPG